MQERCGYLAGSHGVLVGALPALLGVHGDASAPKLVVEEGVVLPWKSLLLKLLLPLAAADPHCFFCCWYFVEVARKEGRKEGRRG